MAIAGDPFAADPTGDPAVLAGYRERFSFASVGARYRARLDALWADGERVGKRLRWRADQSPAGSRAGRSDSTDASLLVQAYYQVIGLVGRGLGCVSVLFCPQRAGG